MREGGIERESGGEREKERGGRKDGVLSLSHIYSSFDVMGSVIAALYQQHELM